MSKAYRLTHRKKDLSQDIAGVPLNFLLGASDPSLDNYELARLAAIADLRGQIQELLDKLHQEMALASLVRWFRGNDRQTLKHAIENEETAEEWAKRMIRDRQRSTEELLPLPSLPPGAAHLAASKRYAERNIAEGKCSECPEPLDRNSVRYCTKHLQNARLRYKPKNAKGSPPGTVGYLYGEGFESQHGRTPGTLQSLAISREKKSRAILAELGLPAGSTATATEAAKAALMEHMPRNKKAALMFGELLEKANLGEIESTAKHALLELVNAGLAKRSGKGVSGDPYRYFAGGKWRGEQVPQ